jgi:hypothetical protein
MTTDELYPLKVRMYNDPRLNDNDLWLMELLMLRGRYGDVTRADLTEHLGEDAITDGIVAFVHLREYGYIDFTLVGIRDLSPMGTYKVSYRIIL